ncbi:hypothetical protein IMSAG185_01654 [Lachnospiraceae bacterium]|nr:FeoB-associated Cys-rich membrane protein [Lachnospiraceae bacterium]GFI66045.1 hypothetical protein IMSAG185_01654 [Lachnospiraceae bacterium]
MGTVVVGGVLALTVVWVVRGMIKNKKSRKTSCGGNCGHCGGCH